MYENKKDNNYNSWKRPWESVNFFSRATYQIYDYDKA